MMSRGSRIMVPLLLLAILGGGVGIGVAVERLWLGARSAGPAAPQRGPRTRDPDQQAAWLLGRFQQKLSLTKNQVDPVRRALRRMFTQLKGSRDRYRAEAKETRRLAREDIRKVLTSDQQHRYEDMVQRYEKRRVERRKGRRRR